MRLHFYADWSAVQRLLQGKPEHVYLKEASKKGMVHIDIDPIEYDIKPSSVSVFLVMKKIKHAMPVTTSPVVPANSKENVIDRANGLYQANVVKYGMHEGHSKWDLAVSYFRMDNDTFHALYGFNFVPKGELFQEAKEYVHEGILKAIESPHINGNFKPGTL